MANTIKVRRSATPAAVPTTTALALGELAINTNDGKLFLKKSVLGVETIVDVTASGGGVSTFSAGTTGLTPTVATSGAVVLAGTLAIANGGTNATTAGGALTSLGAYASSNPSGYTNNTGTVTSVASLTLGTTGTDLSSTVATGTTTPVITLQVPTASATNRGALSSSDWTTFNGKGAGTVTSVGGTGTVVGLTLTGTVTTIGSLTLGGTFALPTGQVPTRMIYDAFTATASQTTFTTSTTYTSGKIEVFCNGVKMNGGDVTVTSGTSVVFATGLAVNSQVNLVYPT